MGNVITATDPLGTTITCSASSWYGHVIKNSGHTIMKSNKVAVIETLHDPDLICESSENDDRLVYFKQGATATYNRGLYTKVITKKIGENQSEVVSAWPQSQPTGGIGDVVYKKTITV